MNKRTLLISTLSLTFLLFTGCAKTSMEIQSEIITTIEFRDKKVQQQEDAIKKILKSSLSDEEKFKRLEKAHKKLQDDVEEYNNKLKKLSEDLKKCPI